MKARIAAVGLLLVFLVGTGITFFVKGESGLVPTDAVSLCPTKRPPSEIVVILLDVSDQFSEPQRLQVQHYLARIRDSIPRFGLVEVYTVDRLGRRVTEHVTHLCNPGAGDDLSQIYQNPELARKKWQGFAAKLRSDIDEQISAAADGDVAHLRGDPGDGAPDLREAGVRRPAQAPGHRLGPDAARARRTQHVPQGPRLRQVQEHRAISRASAPT